MTRKYFRKKKKEKCTTEDIDCLSSSKNSKWIRQQPFDVGHVLQCAYQIKWIISEHETFFERFFSLFSLHCPFMLLLVADSPGVLHVSNWELVAVSFCFVSSSMNDEAKMKATETERVKKAWKNSCSRAMSKCMWNKNWRDWQTITEQKTNKSTKKEYIFDSKLLWANLLCSFDSFHCDVNSKIPWICWCSFMCLLHCQLLCVLCLLASTQLFVSKSKQSILDAKQVFFSSFLASNDERCV